MAFVALLACSCCVELAYVYAHSWAEWRERSRQVRLLQQLVALTRVARLRAIEPRPFRRDRPPVFDHPPRMHITRDAITKAGW